MEASAKRRRGKDGAATARCCKFVSISCCIFSSLGIFLGDDHNCCRGHSRFRVPPRTTATVGKTLNHSLPLRLGGAGSNTYHLPYFRASFIKVSSAVVGMINSDQKHGICFLLPMIRSIACRRRVRAFPFRSVGQKSALPQPPSARETNVLSELMLPPPSPNLRFPSSSTTLLAAQPRLQPDTGGSSSNVTPGGRGREKGKGAWPPLSLGNGNEQKMGVSTSRPEINWYP